MQDGVQGLYVPERSPAALADALEQLARDPERGRAMGAAGRRAMEAAFDADRNVAVLERLFRDWSGRRR
jgi:glycosyltransferase involved in cell wall biosynthesis